jgi:hypothetical protein
MLVVLTHNNQVPWNALMLQNQAGMHGVQGAVQVLLRQVQRSKEHYRAGCIAL